MMVHIVGKDVEIYLDDVLTGSFDDLSIDYAHGEVTREPLGQDYPDRVSANKTGSGTIGGTLFELPGKTLLDHQRNRTEVNIKFMKKGTTEEYECTKCHITNTSASNSGGDNAATQENTFTFEDLIPYTPTP